MRQVPNLHDFKRKKEQSKKISMLTCYDYLSARIIAESHIDAVLVGDSVAMVVHGHHSTIMATMDMMALHTAAVARGLNHQFLVADLPFLSYRASQTKTITHAKTLLQAGAHALKLEGADAHACETVQHLVTSGIPIMGHIGVMPQSVLTLGGYNVQGKTEEKADDLLQQAIALESAGCFAIVLECVPSQLAKRITETLTIPTIGIGAGHHTDGQILVWHDMLGLQTDLKPRFVKRYIEGKAILLDAINTYVEQVHLVDFPTEQQAF